MRPGRRPRADIVLGLPPGWISDGALALRGPHGVRVTVTIEDLADDGDVAALADRARLRLSLATPDLEEVGAGTTSLGGEPARAVRLTRTPADGPAEAWLQVVAVVGPRGLTVTAVADAAATAVEPQLLHDAVAALVPAATDDPRPWAPLVGRLRRGVGRLAGGDEADGPDADDSATSADDAPDPPTVASDEASLLGAVRLLLEAAVEEVVDEASLRAAIAGPAFEEAVGLLAASELPAARLLHEASRDPWYLACAKLEAVARRPPDARIADQLLPRLDRHPGDAQLPFVLRVLETHADGPLVERILATGPGSEGSSFGPSTVHELVAARVAAGEQPDPARLWEVLGDEAPEWLPGMLDDLRFVLPAAFVEHVETGLRGRVARGVLRSVGRLDEGPAEGPDPATVLVTGDRAAALEKLEAALDAEPPRSTLVIGPAGSGRSTVIGLLTARLRARGWTVLEARAADVVAGQKFVGELEERVRALADALATERTLWVLPTFADTYWAGRHHDSPRGVLDLILPLVQAGRIRVVGELDAGEYERLAALRPALRAAFATVTIAPLGPDESLEVARRWVARHADERAAAWEGVLREALQLARHYLRDERLPGSLLRLLDGARAVVATDDARTGPPGPDDLLAVVSARTGVPVDLLDERRPLDLEALRAFFGRRVLGQDEAVSTLVDRVAMIKAGLTDPSRPQGVFLFVGPTGTGKTEIAKALAERVFGSPDRLLRLDMSEFQTSDSLVRLTGDATAGDGGRALVDQIRAQPFSVVLLDEFEKAHPRVWDLFLQVFDDGRLTDAGGRTADFRHCVVILTSNLGAAVATGGIGFAGDAGPSFSPSGVERAVEGAFRPELLNRLDRVVVFRPLSRETMRRIVHHELEALLERRGLRTREWAIEWDASAIEFLLERGFSPALGARPLRRAIEQHLLAPLARTIVARRYPEGDQFLFVRSADERALDVVFVDPDADADPSAPTGAERIAGAAATGLRALALDPHGSAAEWQVLEAQLERLRVRTAGDDWQHRKAETLRRIADPAFWDDPGRFAVLGLGEYLDRIEAGVRGAESLLRRGRGPAARGRGGLPASLAGQLAARLLLLGTAIDVLERDAPRDAFLRVRPGRPDDGRGEAFADRIAEMYGRWARRRGMMWRALDGAGPTVPARLLAVSGFGAHAVLGPEAGVHVLEEPRASTGFDRVTVHVTVAAQPRQPLLPHPDAARSAALEALGDAPSPEAVVRRYRERPSPLVRDAVRGWRTGLLERVLDGDFDLFE